jgi:ribose-phosphate pyrophosphokinase
MKNILNLGGFDVDSDCTIGYDRSTFPGGEVSIRIHDEPISRIETITILARLNTSADIMELAMAKDALDRMDFKSIYVTIPYLPYARQDRKCNPGEAHSLRVMCDMINAMNFESVAIIDPHSIVAEALLNNCYVIEAQQWVDKAIEDMLESNEGRGFDLSVVSPDAGANKRTFAIVDDLKEKFPEIKFNFVKCDKVRDLYTGKIKHTSVNVDEVSERCLIIDDICDSGGTMVNVAKTLKEKGANQVSMFVTHGIFSKGLDLFRDTFETIYTTTSVKKLEDDRIVKQLYIEKP